MILPRTGALPAHISIVKKVGVDQKKTSGPPRDVHPVTDESDEQDPVQVSKTSISASEYDSDMTTDPSYVTTRTSDKSIDTSLR